MTGPLFGLLGACCAVLAESLYVKFGSLGWFRLWLLSLPLQAGISWSIFQITRQDSLLSIPIWFGGSTALLRILSTLWLGQSVSGWTWGAYGLTCLALVVKISGNLSEAR